MVDVMYPTRNTIAMESQTQDRRANMLGRLKDCLKRRSLSDVSDDGTVSPPKYPRLQPKSPQLPVQPISPGGYKKSTALSREPFISPVSCPTPVMVKNEVLGTSVAQQLPKIIDCLRVERGNIIELLEEPIRETWNIVIYRLQNGSEPLPDVQHLLQSFEYFKHLCQHPNTRMLKASNNFWLEQIFTELKPLIIDYPKVMNECDGFHLCVLLMHIVMHKHNLQFCTNDFIMNCIATKKLLYRDCDKQIFTEFIDIHCGRQVEYLLTETHTLTADSCPVVLALKWFPLFSANYRKSMIDNIVVPMLVREIESWTFPAALGNILNILKPWQQVIGTKRMAALQKYVAECALPSLESSTWDASDVRVFVLIKGLFPYVCHEKKEAFLQQSVIPAIQREFSKLCKLSIPIGPEVYSKWKHVMSWAAFIPYETLTSAVIVYYLPQLVLTLSMWLATHPSHSTVRQWFSELCHLIPDAMRDTICVEQYIMFLDNVVKHYCGQLKHSSREDNNALLTGEPLNLTNHHISKDSDEGQCDHIQGNLLIALPSESCITYEGTHRGSTEGNTTSGNTDIEPICLDQETPLTLTTTDHDADHSQSPQVINIQPVVDEEQLKFIYNINSHGCEPRDNGCDESEGDSECDVLLPADNLPYVDEVDGCSLSPLTCSSPVSCTSPNRCPSPSTPPTSCLSPVSSPSPVSCPSPAGSPSPANCVSPVRTPSIPDLHHLSSTINKLQRCNSQVVTYRQLLQEKADELGVSFNSVPKKLENGSQIYRFGTLKLYIKSGKIFTQSGHCNTWVPTKLSAISDML